MSTINSLTTIVKTSNKKVFKIHTESHELGSWVTTIEQGHVVKRPKLLSTKSNSSEEDAFTHHLRVVTNPLAYLG